MWSVSCRLYLCVSVRDDASLIVSVVRCVRSVCQSSRRAAKVSSTKSSLPLHSLLVDRPNRPAKSTTTTCHGSFGQVYFTAAGVRQPRTAFVFVVKRLAHVKSVSLFVVRIFCFLSSLTATTHRLLRWVVGVNEAGGEFYATEKSISSPKLNITA